MSEAMSIGATGLHAYQRQIDTIAHNLANVNTVGFRRSSVSFAEVSAALSAGSNDPIAQAVGEVLGTRGAGTRSNVHLSSSGGELVPSSEMMDVAIDGQGLFEVVRPDGSLAYTRAGTWRLDAAGELTTSDGATLSSQINIPPDAQAIEITPDGRVLARIDGFQGDMEVGQFELVNFANTGGLQAVGNNLFVATAESGEPQVGIPGENGIGLLRQGFVESSNVKLVDEMVLLMMAQRAFEMNGRIVQAADQMMAITNSLYRS